MILTLPYLVIRCLRTQRYCLVPTLISCFSDKHYLSPLNPPATINTINNNNDHHSHAVGDSQEELKPLLVGQLQAGERASLIDDSSENSDIIFQV